jgi:PEP-CTERM motif
MKPTTQRRTLMTLGLIAFFAAVLPGTLRADTTQLTLSSVSGNAGQVVTVDGTISNTGGPLVNLNGENFTLGSDLNFLNGDVTDFLNNAPLFLLGNTDSGLIALFSFEIAPGTPPGTYSGNSLQILGGPGAFDANALASASFTIDVKGTKAPEPSPLLLLCLGLLGILSVARRTIRA